MERGLASWVVAVALAQTAAGQVAPQDVAERVRVKRLAEPQANLFAPGAGLGARPSGERPAILLTGYWPPSNEAIRRFNANPAQNPQGWIGLDWENRGYDVYAFFPEFSPPNCSSCGTGTGALEVDYQDTSADWWPIAEALEPIAIITHSRAGTSDDWELEMNQFNRSNWVDDFVPPLQPTPSPPDASVPAGTLRPSTLPVQEIIDDVELANLGIDPYICFTLNGGGFLSEFMAYHGVWYQDIRKDPNDPAWCIASGHVHIGSLISWQEAERAAKATLRTVIRYVDGVRFGPTHDVDLYCATSSNSAGQGAMLTNTGSTSIAANDLRWLVNDAPPAVNGILFFGSGAQETPFGNGKMCVAAPRRRVPPLAITDPDGFLDFPVDLTSAPFTVGASAISPGTSWNFQFYYRDAPAGGAMVNLTSAATVTFFP